MAMYSSLRKESQIFVSRVVRTLSKMSETVLIGLRSFFYFNVPSSQCTKAYGLRFFLVVCTWYYLRKRGDSC